jgi:hypothetical protein
MGLYDYQRRHRRRYWSRLLTGVAVLAVIGGIGAFSYQLGVEQVKSREVSLREEIAALTAAKEQVDKRAAQLQTVAQNAEIRANELKVLYDRDAPQGDLKKLVEIIDRKLKGGVDPGRLSRVLEQTSTPQSCSMPETKRFVLPTGAAKGAANTSVSFANGTIVVTGEGPPARDAGGNAEAWFDTSQPVTITFTQADGKTTTASGILPLQQSIIIDDKEHRFKINAGARSFVEVIGDRCPFP